MEDTSKTRYRKSVRIICEWEGVIMEAQMDGYMFGKPMDEGHFTEAMKLAFDWFFADGKPQNQFDRFDIEIYGMIKAYAEIQLVERSEDSKIFEACTYAAGLLAFSILHPEDEEVRIEGTKILDSGFTVGGKTRTVTYDFETGDLGDYIELIEMGYWD